MDGRQGLPVDLEGRSLKFDDPSNSEDHSLAGLPCPAIEDFAVRIHRSLNPREVIALALHELRPALSCERVSYLERRGTSFRLVAASGLVDLPKRSRSSSLLETFVAAILTRKARFQFPDEDLTLPADLGRKLADYWEQSNGQLILVEPVFSTVQDPDPSCSDNDRVLVGAVVLEQFSQTDFQKDTTDRLEAAMRHFTSALENARRYSRLVSIPGLYQLGIAYEQFRHNARVAALGYLALVSLLVWAASTVKRPFEIECHGRLMPVHRREVFASVDGEITDVAVAESENVEPGQILCRLRSRELEKAIIEQTGLLKGKLKARDAARAELRSRSGAQGRTQPARDQAQLELIHAEIDTIQRQLELFEEEEKQLEVRAPMAGRVMTERPDEKLKGRPVRRGEPLLEIMQDTGGWQLELAVAERRLGHLLAYHQTNPVIDVKFRLLSSVQKSFDCQVTRFADRTVPSLETGSASGVYCDVSEIDQLPRQIGAEVSARIQCGRRSLLYIWFHEFWELLQRNWWI